jgi:hypothetical protein
VHDSFSRANALQLALSQKAPSTHSKSQRHFWPTACLPSNGLSAQASSNGDCSAITTHWPSGRL